MEKRFAENIPLVVQGMSKTDRQSTFVADIQQNGDSNNANKKSDNDSKGEQKSGLKSFTRLSGRRKYTLILITLATFLGGVAFSIIGPFYPIEASKKGMSITAIGFVFGVFEFVIFLTAPLYGNYLVKLGPRFVLIAGIFVGGSCNILFGALQYCPSGTPFLVMSMLTRSVEALGFSGFITSSFAIVSSEFKDNIGLAFGILETGTGLGFLLGPSLGGVLYELGGFGVPFYSAGIGVLLNGIALYKFLPIIEEIPAKRKGSILTLLRTPMVFVPLGSVMIGVISLTTYDSTFAKRLEPMNFTVGIVGAIFCVVALLYSITSIIWGYISDSMNIQAPLIITGHFILGSAFFLLGPSVLLPFVRFNLVTVIAGLACIGVSIGCAFIPTMKCTVMGAIEAGFEENLDTYALVSGIFNSVTTVGGFTGPVVMSSLVQEFDFPVAYTVVGMCNIFMMIASFTFFTYRNFRRQKGLFIKL